MPATAKRERSGGDGPRPSLRDRQVAGLTNLQGGQGVVFARLSEQGEELNQALADDIGISADVHKVGIAAPPGDDVYVEMAGQACACTSAEVHTDIEAVRVDCQRKRFLRFADELGHFEHLVVVGLVEVGDVPQRRYQQVAVVVRVAVQDYDALIGAPKDEILVVLLRGIAVIADKTAGSLV